MSAAVYDRIAECGCLWRSVTEWDTRDGSYSRVDPCPRYGKQRCAKHRLTPNYDLAVLIARATGPTGDKGRKDD